MAADIAYFAAKTIGMSKVNGRKPCDLLTAARHNLREIQAELGSVGRIDPGHGHIDRPIVPPHGTEKALPVPPHGTIRGAFGALSVPPHGHLSREPSTAKRSGDVQEVEGVQERWANIEQDDDAASSRREAAPRPTRPRRRPKGPGLDDAQHVPQPPDPTAQLELLLP